MPPLSQTLRSSSPPGFSPAPSGYIPAPPSPQAPVPLPGEGNSFTANRWIRSPLPPINAGPDSLRQFDDGDTGIPRRRLLPLPHLLAVGDRRLLIQQSFNQPRAAGRA